MKFYYSLFAILAALSCHAEIQVATALLVDIDAKDLSGIAAGSALTGWANKGTLGGTFIPAGGSGAILSEIEGVPSVRFDGTASTVMTNTVKPCAEMLGSSDWSAEIWVYKPGELSSNPQAYLAWTLRDGLVTEDHQDGNAGTVAEFRYDGNVYNCVEHYHKNIPWGGKIAIPGHWHSIVLTRASNGMEKLYVDGQYRTTVDQSTLDLRDGGPITLGAILRRGTPPYFANFFDGYLTKVRIHDGTLTDQQVLQNFQEDSKSFPFFWNAAPEGQADWHTPENWSMGVQPSAGSVPYIANGGKVLLSSENVTLEGLHLVDGELTIDNGAELRITGKGENFYPGNNANFSLRIPHGTFLATGDGSVNIYSAGNGGNIDVELGSVAGEPALLQIDRDFVLAHGLNSQGQLRLHPNSVLVSSNGWCYIAQNDGARGSLIVDGGTLDSLYPYPIVVINNGASSGELVVNSGLVIAHDKIFFSRETPDSSTGSGVLRLNGGVAEVGEFSVFNPNVDNRIYLNGGTIHALRSNANYMNGFTTALVQAGGVTIDVPAGAEITIAQSLIEDETSPGGILRKTGEGTLILSGISHLSTPLQIEGGTVVFSRSEVLNAFPSLTLTNGGAVSAPYANGTAELLAKISPDASGYLVISPANANEDIDFSGYPHMKLRLTGNQDYTGTFTPYGNHISLDIPDGTTTLSRSFTDVSATEVTSLTISGGETGKLILTGESTLTGTVTIDTVKVELQTLTALGSTAPIVLRNRAKLYFMQPQDLTAFTQRLQPGADGYLLMGRPESGSGDLDLSNHPDLVIGAAYQTNILYTGTITPAENTYRLGGGEGSYYSGLSGFTVSNLVDVNQQPARLVADGAGMVGLDAGNTYSGGTVISNNAAVFYKTDAFGAVPGTEDPDNIFIDKGVLRGGPADVIFPATRGIQIADGGVLFHQWSIGSTTIRGNVHGTGPIQISDMGPVILAGEQNDWKGRISISSSSRLVIGDGAHFSLDPAVQTDISGILSLHSDQNQRISNSFKGYGILRKEGAGEMTLTGPYAMQKTEILNGPLLFENDDLTRNAEGNVQVERSGTLELDGKDLKIGALSGFGKISNRKETPASLTMESRDKNLGFSGAIDPSISLVKQGEYRQELANLTHPVKNMTVSGGVLASLGGNTFNRLELRDGVLRIGNNKNGLFGSYYKDRRSSENLFTTLQDIYDFEKRNSSKYQSFSSDMGPFFDSGSQGEHFPPNFSGDVFIIIWHGFFKAETDGVYSFSLACDDHASIFIGEQQVIKNVRGGYRLDDRLTMGEITLTKGFHPITITFGELWGAQAITAFYKRPGAEECEVLPNALLSESEGGDTTIHDFNYINGLLDFSPYSAASLILDQPGDYTLDLPINGELPESRICKRGAGTMTLAAQSGNYSGRFHLEEGNIVLENNRVLGILSLSSGTHALVNSDTPSGIKNGLVMNYYPNVNEFSYDSFLSYEKISQFFAGLTPEVSESSLRLGETLDSGNSGERFHPQFGGDYFVVSLKGYIQLDESGTYSFGANSDDGSVVYIDRKLVASRAYDTGRTADPSEGSTGTIALEPGIHEIFIGFREKSGAQSLQISMKKPSESAFRRIPQAILFPQYHLLGGLESEASGMIDLQGNCLRLEQKTDTTFSGTMTGTKDSLVLKKGTGELNIAGDNPDFHGKITVGEGSVALTGNGTIGDGSLTISPEALLSIRRAGTLRLAGLRGYGEIVVDGGCDVQVQDLDFTGKVRVIDGNFTMLSSKNTILSDQIGVFVGNTLTISGTGKTLLTEFKPGSQLSSIRLAEGQTGVLQRQKDIGNTEITLADGTLATEKSGYPSSDVLIGMADAEAWQHNGETLVKTNDMGNIYFALTKNVPYVAGSSFLKERISMINPWHVKFRYSPQMTTKEVADGFSFMIQGEAATAVGGNGGCKGGAQYEGGTKKVIRPAVAAVFNIYQKSTFAWTIDGNPVASYRDISPIVLTNGVDISISYDQGVLSLSVEQEDEIFTSTLEVNISERFQQETAFIGFTAANGGCYAEHDIYDFVLSDIIVPENTALSNTVVTVEAGKNGTISSDLPSSMIQEVALEQGASLQLQSGERAAANEPYQVEIGTLRPAGNANLALRKNGIGDGTLLLSRIDATVPGTITVAGGKIAAKDNRITITTTTPVPKGITYLLRFAEGTVWEGALPTLTLQDQEGNLLTHPKVGISERGIYLSTCSGSVLLLR